MDDQSSDTVRIGIAQYTLPWEGKDLVHHEGKVADFISDLGARQCDVIALPELCTTPYFPVEQKEEVFSLAMKADAPFVMRVMRMASEYRSDILLPVFEDAGAGVYYNSVFHLDRNGRLAGRYRKTHVPAVRSVEKYYFRPGAEIGVFEAGWGRFGCLLCQDRFFPEASRVLALQGASVIFVLNASADYARFAETWEPICVTRAYENGCFLVAVNRCGTQGQVKFFGRSMVVAPDGQILDVASDEEVVMVTDIDLREVRRFRHTLQMYRDYRPELYGAIGSFSGMEDD